MQNEWKELKEWAKDNNILHIVKILIESGLSNKEIINELKISDKEYEDIIKKIN